MIDDMDKVTEEAQGFLERLAQLPGSYDGPDGLRAEPYGLSGFGEASGLARALAAWVDAPLVVDGTQFLLASGFDYGALAPLKLSAEMVGADAVVLGYVAHEPALRVEPGPLSLYTYASYLAYATGHGEALAEAEIAMKALAMTCTADIETERNPAKSLAWTLWNRVPLLLAGREGAGLPELLQRVFARVGKTLAITVGDHPLEVLSGAFEGRHQLGDDVLALVVGPQDEELRLAVEVLGTRVAQVETMSLPFGGLGETVADPGARALVFWYITMWVSAYLALLHEMNPADSVVYSKLADVVRERS